MPAHAAPHPPADGYFIWDELVALVDGSANHTHCPRAAGGGGLAMEVTGRDGIPTYHDVTGTRIGCILPLLHADERVTCYRFRMIGSVLRGR